MAKGKGGSAGPVRVPTRPDDIRNVVLVGHADAGKTALVEALLTATGSAPRGTAAPPLGAAPGGPGATGGGPGPGEDDHHTTTLTVYPLDVGPLTVNLFDTPGLPDFVGELRAGLRAADGALFVVSAASEIDPATVALWGECAALGTPRALVVTRLDAARGSYEETVARCRDAFAGAVPLYVLDHGGTSVVGLLSRNVYDYSGGHPAQTRPHDPSRDVDIVAARAELLEAVIETSEDESLLERYLGGEEIEFDVLMRDLERAVCRGTFFPVLPACAGTGLGLAEVLEVLAGGFPPPTDRDLPPVRDLDGTPVEVGHDPDGPLLAEVVRTSVDPYLGRVTVLRLFSGTLTKDDPVHVCGRGGEARGHPDHDSDEPVGQLFSPLGSQLRPVDRVVAGDVCAVARLSNAETGDTLSARTRPLVVEPWALPEPLLPTAVEPVTRADDDALPKALSRLTAADPTVRVERNAETGQLVLWCLGEAHAEAVTRTLARSGAQVHAVPLRVALRATFAGECRGHGRLVKQSGGHGQYAVCDVVVTPLERGEGVRFEQKVVGGAVPSQFIGSVEKGVRAQLERGLDAEGVPVTDVLVTLVDGKAHSVDSSDAAFQTAGALAVKDAAAAGAVLLLEPLAEVAVDVPDGHVGAVMSDLAGRRGRVTGTDAAGDGRSVVHAEVPEAELTTYIAALRSMTGGTGSFTRHFARYQQLDAAAARRLAEV